MQKRKEIRVRMVSAVAWFIITLCMWAIDISVTAMNAGLVLTNGLWEMNPMVLYHVALWIIPVAFLSQVKFHEVID